MCNRMPLHIPGNCPPYGKLEIEPVNEAEELLREVVRTCKQGSIYNDALGKAQQYLDRIDGKA